MGATRTVNPAKVLAVVLIDVQTNIVFFSPYAALLNLHLCHYKIENAQITNIAMFSIEI